MGKIHKKSDEIINKNLKMNFKQYLATFFLGLLVSTSLIIWNTFFGAGMSLFVFIVLFLAIFYGCFKFPKRAFLIFVMLIPLENIIVTPEQFPVSLRPFQLVGAILALVIAFLGYKKKPTFELLSFKKICLYCKISNKKSCDAISPSKAFGTLDRLIFVLPIFAFLAVINSPLKAVSLKLAIILFSFVVLYWLIRNFTQSKYSIIETLLFFVFGSIPVIFWSFYQAIAKIMGWQDFQVFTARVNGTFTEPDWLGVYLTLMIATLLWFRHLAKPDKSNLMVFGIGVSRIFGFFTNLYFIIAFSVLLLTVSRSAWLGVFVVMIVYFKLLFIDNIFHKTVSFKEIFKNAFVLGFLSLVAVAIISFTGLSTFHFGNRAASSISGKQLITISCEKDVELPDEIFTMEELDIFGCRHINLEEVEVEKKNKMLVTTIMRPDPNVNIRKDIYGETVEQIKKHPILGQGLGSASAFLGIDDHGSGLNASNIILEIFLSMGALATIMTIYIVGFLILWSSMRVWRIKKHVFSSFVLLSGVAIIVPNMFNSGLLMGMFWFWLAVMISIHHVMKGEG